MNLGKKYRYRTRKWFLWVGFVLLSIFVLAPINVVSSSIDTATISGNDSPDGKPPGNTTWQCFLPLILKEDCAPGSFGTMLLSDGSTLTKDPADVMIFANDQMGMKGMVSAGAPSDFIRDEWFSRLPGWIRSFNRGTYEQLLTIHDASIIFNMADMYECIGYGPESVHQAGVEALEPLVWVPKAKTVADADGKCLIYGPAVLDYERMTTISGESLPDQAALGNLISSVSPYVDIWMIQLAKYQRWTDAGHDDFGNPFTIEDFSQWVKWWVAQIKRGNPETKVWVQLGIGVFDPILDRCLEPQPPEYILNYQQTLTNAGIDGVFVVPAQPCQTSTDPIDRENYQKTLDVYQEAISRACGN